MITFERIRWKNLLSTGNSFTEISLNDRETTLIIGENGAGKSTILDAMCFALFGKPFRRINKPALINSVNGKQLLVELEFRTNGKDYKIVRGIKPNKFEIHQNGVMINQDSTVKDYQEQLEKFILKMNFKSFTSIVILGSASFTPFMQLSAADRRLVIEDLLDIQVFSTMNVLVRQRLQENKEQINLNKIEIESCKDRIKYLKELTETNQNDLNQEIMDTKENLSSLETEHEKINQLIRHQRESIKDSYDIQTLTQQYKKYNTKLREFYQLRGKIENNRDRIEREITFYQENEVCPSCKQGIEHEHKTDILDQKNNTLAECLDGLDKLNEKVDEFTSKSDVAKKEIDRIEGVFSEIERLESKKKYVLNDHVKWSKRMEQLISGEFKTGVQELNESKLEESKKQYKVLVNRQHQLLDEYNVLDITMKLLKDGGIKSKIIKQYLPVINKKVNQYLHAMEFFVQFELDENFNEALKARHLDLFSYANFSEGEKMRIDLALLFTWRAVAKMRNSVHTNLLLLDEIFDSSLDGAGTEEFLKIMMTLIGDTNVFVISHKTDQLVDKFDKVLRFEKHKGFSRLKE